MVLAMTDLSRTWSIDDLRTMARRRLPRGVFEFFDGGAEDEVTLRGNRTGWERVQLLPKVLVNVAQVDTSACLLGGPVKLPLAISPTGGVGFGQPDGDVAIARAAAAFGIPYSLSTSATTTIERIAKRAPGRLWFQAYILKEREFTVRLIERAKAAGYEGLIITVDLPVGGKRERDLHNDLSFPFRLTARNFTHFAARPRWSLNMLMQGMPVMENLAEFSAHVKQANAGVWAAGRNYDPSFEWSALSEIRDLWPGKLLLKGVVRPDDAERAVDLGCDAIVVSNHGGRQLDTAVASVDALPAVARAVRGRASVLVDGGVRRGVDIVKALALGADGVMIGRPTLFGVLAAGEDGARRALDILHTEFVRAMQLCGARTISEITPCLVRRPDEGNR
jgi:(S)-mandelate dehydrogenase